MKKIIYKLCLIMFVVGIMTVTSLPFKIEEAHACDKVTIQKDDGEMCDPQGDDCIVCWGKQLQ